MNNSQKTAESLAERIHEAQRLAERGNAHSYNWNSLVQLLGYLDEPQEVAKGLLFVYFEFTSLLAQAGQDYGCIQDELSGGLYRLRSVYEAIRDMSDTDDALVRIAPRTDLR